MRNAVLSLYDAPDHPNVPSDAGRAGEAALGRGPAGIMVGGAAGEDYRHVAFNQWAVLAAFETAGWAAAHRGPGSPMRSRSTPRAGGAKRFGASTESCGARRSASAATGWAEFAGNKRCSVEILWRSQAYNEV